jgi:(S)-2-hydroxy-acid oxidase
MSDFLVGRLAVADFEQVAQLVLPAPIYGWIASGSQDQQSLIDNVAAFRRWRLSARMLTDVRNVDISTTVCGTKLAFPLMVAPMGLHKAVHPDGELATAAAVTATGSLFVEAVNATTTM